MRYLSIEWNSMRLSDREAQKVTKNCTQNCAEGWWWWGGGCQHES